MTIETRRFIREVNWADFHQWLKRATGDLYDTAIHLDYDRSFDCYPVRISFQTEAKKVSFKEEVWHQEAGAHTRGFLQEKQQGKAKAL